MAIRRALLTMKTFIVPMTGSVFWNQLLAVTDPLTSCGCFVVMLALQILRSLALPKRVKEWSLRTLRVKLIKIGVKALKHARYVTIQMGTLVEVRQRNDNQWPNSCFSYYCG